MSMVVTTIDLLLLFYFFKDDEHGEMLRRLEWELQQRGK